jgi:hypothetical protein
VYLIDVPPAAEIPVFSIDALVVCRYWHAVLAQEAEVVVSVQVLGGFEIDLLARPEEAEIDASVVI